MSGRRYGLLRSLAVAAPAALASSTKKRSGAASLTPGARLFQCANAEAKSVWMDAFENAKRSRQKQRGPRWQVIGRIIILN